MGTGVVIALAAVVLAAGFGLYRARTDGRFRRPSEMAEHATEVAEQAPSVVEQVSAGSTTDERRDHGADGGDLRTAWDDVRAAIPDAELGERATLLQFSSAFCAPCRVTRQVLSDVAGLVPGVVHLEVDAEQHLDLVRRLDVRRTPTTLVLDARGAEATRAAGAPRREVVLSTLDGIV